jgi:cation transport regulator ChaC
VGTFHYFAYGSNMLTARLRAPTRCPSAEPLEIGTLAGHAIAFRKKSSDGSAKCDIPVGKPRDVVHGVVFRIAASERERLDEAEGLGKGYDVAEVEIVTPQGTTPCVAYVATRINDGLRPYDWYRSLVLAGALEHGLPESYISQIAETPAIHDPRPGRGTRREALRALEEFSEQFPHLKTRLTGVHDGQALA